MSKRGWDLKVGDMLNTWMGRSRIVALTPYQGPLVDLFPDGAQIALFDTGRSMTIDNIMMYVVVA